MGLTKAQRFQKISNIRHVKLLLFQEKAKQLEAELIKAKNKIKEMQSEIDNCEDLLLVYALKKYEEKKDKSTNTDNQINIKINNDDDDDDVILIEQNETSINRLACKKRESSNL